MGEFGIIKRMQRLLPVTPSVIEGIGDDCAVFRSHDRLYLATCDMSVEGIHFRRDFAAPDEIGWKAAVASVSDIAAMGGIPLFSIVSMACPGDTPAMFVEDLCNGMSSALSPYGAVIVGGDTTESPERIVLDVTVIGEMHNSRYLRRGGALIGDVLAVTGYPGLSRGGLDALKNDRQADELVKAYRRPRPRVAEGQWLADNTLVHSMIDLSDGLVADTGHMAAASNVGIDILTGQLPVHPALAAYCEETGGDPVEYMLGGGEDYELAFTIEPNQARAVIDQFHQEFSIPVTVIGAVAENWDGVRVDGDTPTCYGYEHFSDA
jgi:thiamine-monophosphate kinase